MKKLLLIVLSIFIWNVAQAQMSKGTTYYYQDKGTEKWMKINTGTWMGETWISLLTSDLPDNWMKTEILQNESTDTYTVVKFPNSDFKMKIEFNEKGLWFSDVEGKERTFFRLYERYGVKVD